MIRLLVLLSLSLVHADDKKKSSDPTPIEIAKLDRKEPISYEKDISPIFVDKCQVCHAGNLIEGRFDLGTYAALMKGGKRGPAIVPGKAEESFLWLVSSHRKKPIMPPKSEDNPLTPAEVAVLKRWIDEGARGPEKDVRVRPPVVVNVPPPSVTPVLAVALSPDASTVAVGRGNQLHLFDAKTGKLSRTLIDSSLKRPDGKPVQAAHLSLIESMAYSPDGKTLATGSFREVKIWDMARGEPRFRIDGFADRVVTLAYSPFGKRLAAGGGAPTEDGEIKILDPRTGAILADWPGKHSDTVFGLAFRPDGMRLATASADKFVKVFEFPSGKQDRSFEGHTAHVMDVGWSPDGKRLVSASADNSIKIWDYEKGEKIRDVPGHQKQVTRLQFVGRKAQFLSASGDSSVRLWNAENGGPVRTFAGSKDFVYAIAASADGNLILAGGDDGLVRVYNGNNGQIQHTLTPEPGPAKDKK